VTWLSGLAFLWTLRPRWARRRAWWPGLLAYLHWRLGTVYGSFDAEGRPRPVRALLRDLWNDRRQARRFLLWRHEMERLRRRR
jgi:hypothetical protein